MNPFRNMFNQNILIWGNPVPDGYGTYTFDTPTSRKVRWEDKIEVIKDADGQERVSESRIYSDEEFTNGNWVLQGILSDLDSEDDSPRDTEDAYEILSTGAVTDIKNKNTLYMAYL